MTPTPALSRARTFARRIRGLNASTLRAAWWTMRSMRRLRARLRHDGLRARVPPPPSLPPSAVRGVNATTRYMRATCLERSMLLQQWLLAQGQPHALIIGVPRPGEEPFIAHAWLEGHDRADDVSEFAELVRLDPQ